VGLGLVIGYVLADEASWRKEGLELASISVQQCANVREALQEDPSVQQNVYCNSESAVTAAGPTVPARATFDTDHKS
jgi:hypothetical protein